MGQVQLPDTDTARLLPTGGTNGQALQIVANKPAWAAPTGGGDTLVQRYTSSTQIPISSVTLNYIIDTVTLTDAQKKLRDTTEWKISHYLKVNIKVATSGNFRLAIWPTGSTTALTTTTYEALPTTATDKELKIDVPSTATNGYRAVLEFDQVVGQVTIENVTSISFAADLTGGTPYTNEQARDAVGNALVAGESQSDIDTTRRDIANAIELNLKPNVVDFANMAKNATDTTKLKEQDAWQAGVGLKNAIEYTQTTDRSLLIPNTGPVTLHRVDISPEMAVFAKTTDWVIDHFIRLTIRKSGAGKAPVKVRLSTIGGTTIHESVVLPNVTSTNSTHEINLSAVRNSSYNVQLVDANGANVTVQYTSIANIFTAGAGIRDKLVALPSTGGVSADGDDRSPATAIKGIPTGSSGLGQVIARSSGTGNVNHTEDTTQYLTGTFNIGQEFLDLASHDEYSIVHKVTVDVRYSSSSEFAVVWAAVYRPGSTEVVVSGDSVRVDNGSLTTENKLTLAVEIPATLTGNYRIGLGFAGYDSGQTINVRNWSTILFISQGIDRLSELKDIDQPSGGIDSQTVYKIATEWGRWRVLRDLTFSPGITEFPSDTTRTLNFTSTSSKSTFVGFYFIPDIMRTLLATGDYKLKIASNLVVRAVGGAVQIRLGSSYRTQSGTQLGGGSSDPSTTLSTTSDTTISPSKEQTFSEPSVASFAQIDLNIKPTTTGTRGVIIRSGSYIIVYLKAQ